MGQVMITGASGYLGKRLARCYIQNTDAPLLLWVHARSGAELQAREQALRRDLAGGTQRVACAGGDLAEADPFATLDPTGIDTIIHAAAVTRFDVDEATAQSVNVDGTVKLLRFARRCPNLRALGLLSTVYASGLQAGRIKELSFRGEAGFANHYERSKWAAEQVLLEEFPDLPWCILRLATVIADDETGRVVQFNAFHHTLRLVYYGLLSLVPGRADTPVYLMTGDLAAEATGALIQSAPLRTIYHLAPAQEEAITLGELVDLAYAVFQEDEAFRARRILKPMLCDAESFALLAEGVRGLEMGLVGQAMNSLAPFARQLFIRKDIRNRNLAQAWPAYQPPDAGLLVRRTVEYLVRNRWGREKSYAASRN